MSQRHRVRSIMPRGKRLKEVTALAVLAAVVLAGGAPRLASADACSDCSAPSGERLQQLGGFTLEERQGLWGPSEDYVEVDGGACDVSIDGEPTFRMVNSYLVMAGSGEVWDCPESSSCDTMSITFEEEHGGEWTESGEAGVGIGAYGATLSAKIMEMVKRSFRVRTVTRLDKHACAKYCHRIQWEGYFEVGTFECTVHFTITREFAWWTKNKYTGPDVHQRGRITVDCGSGEATFRRTAPINAFFHLFDGPCEHAVLCKSVTSRDLGWWPKARKKSPPVTFTEQVPPELQDPGTKASGSGGDGSGDGGEEVEDSGDLPVAPTGRSTDPFADDPDGPDEPEWPTEHDPRGATDWWPFDFGGPKEEEEEMESVDPEEAPAPLVAPLDKTEPEPLR